MRLAALCGGVSIAALVAIGCSIRSGEIWGPVTDAQGRGIPAARVIVSPDGGGAVRETTTNGRGWYAVEALRPGRYVVRAEAPGMAAAEATVDLESGATFTQGLTLRGAASPPLAMPPPPPPQARVEVGIELGVEGGIPGGVVGGVPGGVVGGVVGGLPDAFLAPIEVPTAGAGPAQRWVGPMNTEAYARLEEGAFLDPRRHPLSTFSADVDTASYANTRRFLSDGRLPPKDAVRIEEFLNSFAYDYPPPAGEAPFSVYTELGACPWNPAHRLLLVGLQGRAIEEVDLPPRNLVFLVDVSGSMNEPRKLPLLKSALRLLSARLRPIDTVAMVAYAGSSGLVLPRTSGAQRPRILEAIDRLQAGGSTNGGQGIELAYRIAVEGKSHGALSRVILATDGDFNVGVTDHGALTRLIEEKRETGVFLSVLGFGDGNLKDSTMEALADRGNGNYAYIDSVQEAHKVLVREGGGTLVTIAKDVKLQLELNPRRVGAYRLLGYENRRLRDEDFKDDRKDAGEIGAGHRVSALYEIAPPGEREDMGEVDPLKYQEPAAVVRAADSDELATLKLRYKEPEGHESRLLTRTVGDTTSAVASADFTFASAVAEFALLLRDSRYRGRADYDSVLARAHEARGEDPHGDRTEFIRLVEVAKTIAAPARSAASSAGE